MYILIVWLYVYVVKIRFIFHPFEDNITVPLYTCKSEKGVSVLLYVTGSNQFYREARLGNTSIYAVYLQIRRAPFLNSAVINKTYMASTNQKSCADPGFFPRGGSEGCSCFIVLCEITNTEGSS